MKKAKKTRTKASSKAKAHDDMSVEAQGLLAFDAENAVASDADHSDEAVTPELVEASQLAAPAGDTLVASVPAAIIDADVEDSKDADEPATSHFEVENGISKAAQVDASNAAVEFEAKNEGAPSSSDPEAGRSTRQEGADDRGFESQSAQRRPSDVPDTALTVKLSASLVQKLKHSAYDEGISLDALVSELLAEGVVLRAWEIIERKSAMRGGNPNHQGGGGNFRHQGGGGNHQHHRRGGGNQQHNQHNRGGGGGGGGGNHQGRRGGGNNAWMEDKAAFLEYVRNQEKRRR